MQRLLALSLTLCALAASAAAKSTPEAIDVKIAPGKIHEECMRLEAGDKRAYHWKSSGPVDFNIHYHEGPEVSYPVKRDMMRGDGGTFVAKTSQDYCWMWTAKKSEVRIQGGIK